MNFDFLILGSKGQISSDFIKKLNLKCVYISYKKFITNSNIIEKKINKYKPKFLINCFADTDVENSNSKFIESYKSNSLIVIQLTEICNKYKILLIHISTDFIHNGKKSIYNENDEYKPLNVYGISKSIGEIYIQNFSKSFVIFRAGWLFSEQKSSFLYKLYKKLSIQRTVEIVNFEYGRPTSANYFTNTILDTINLLKFKDFENQIFNISQQPTLNRFDFAKAILIEFQKKGKFLDRKVKPSSKIISNIKRPLNTSLSSSKIRKKLNIKNSYWKNDLKNYIDILSS